MEELAALFGDEVMAHLTADGTGIVESGLTDQAMVIEEKIAREDEERRGSLEDDGKVSGMHYHVETAKR